MFCEKCQTENHEQNNYCTNCGRRLLKNKIPTADLDDLEKNSRTINSINRIINLERQVKKNIISNEDAIHSLNKIKLSTDINSIN